MNKKTTIQILLIFLIFLFSTLFYLKYFKNSQKISENIPKEEQIITSQNDSSTYIDNVNYISSDTRGNRYQITAEQAEIKIEDSDVMLLENVVAYIFIKDSDTIMITSNFGVYNSKNYDTIFSENVIKKYTLRDIYKIHSSAVRNN